MVEKKKKREALTVTRLINEVLVNQLSIPLRQIVNDTTFEQYTASKRPDLLISEVEYDGNNDYQFIENLVAYAEVKDNCSVDDKDWNNAIDQGKLKSEKLNLPYFIVTNCKTSIFYNRITGKEILVNKNPVREFQTIDILRLIKNRLKKDAELENIQTNVDSVSTISEAVFNKKLWELANIYRGISFKDNAQKIDFTIGFVALRYFEEKARIDDKLDATKIFWTNCDDKSSAKLIANLSSYIQRLESETDFNEFKSLMEIVRTLIIGETGKSALIDEIDVKNIYDIIESMGRLHGCGFDLFGAVYEMFASSKEKKDFGEYFTRRHYAHIFAKLLLKSELYFDNNKKFKILDPACGTGGFLTESFKVLVNNYDTTKTFNDEARCFLEKECLYGVDIREDNISRTKLNMFLVGDGHTNIHKFDSLKQSIKTKIGKNQFDYLENQFDYIITNPPYGSGTIRAETNTTFTNRKEIAFICRVIKLLKIGKKACIITPDGVLENPSYKEFRKELFEKCDINAIISLPKFAFAPYTKEKTYALFITKRSNVVTKIQKDDIWIYIIDNDGLANSDKRFPTKLRNNQNGWMHDEISGWISTDGEEMAGLLEDRWLKFDDSVVGGTEWIDERGIKRKLRKGGFLKALRVNEDRFKTLLPEYYLRPYEPKYATLEELSQEIEVIEGLLKESSTISEFKPLAQGNANITSYKFLDVFNPIEKGNFALTEEAMYKSIQYRGEFIPVWGGNQDHIKPDRYIPEKGRTSKNCPITIFEGEGIIISLDGSAGSMTYKKGERFALNHHAGFAVVRDDAKDKIIPSFFALFYQDQLREASLSEGSKTLTLDQIYSLDFEVPNIDVQKEIMSKIKPLLAKKSQLQKIHLNIEDLFSKKISS